MGRAFRAALALLLCLHSAAALAAGTATSAMPIGPATTTPIGWIMFCQQNDGECRPLPAEPSTPRELDEALLSLASDINRRVNDAVQPITDRAQYGVEERWTYPHGRGDCEDFALEKRRALHEAGIPMADLLMTVVRKPNGEGHAVLALRTEGGDLLLDNLDKRVRAWNETNYTFVKRQSSADPNVWLSIVRGADVAVGAVRK